MSIMLHVKPIPLALANETVRKWHSHHKPARGHHFSIGAYIEDKLVGVAIVSRPVAPELDDGYTREITRVATNGAKNAASMLLGAAARASMAMGCRRVVTYTRADEVGTCCKAAGFIQAATVKGRAWDSGNKETRWLPGLYEPSTEIIDRIRWERNK